MAKSEAKQRKRRPDPLRVQLKLKVRPGVKPTADRMKKAVEAWANDGKQHDADIIVSGVRWQNPARVKPELRNWRSSDGPNESVENARLTLRLRSWLRGRISLSEKMGPGGGNGKAKPVNAGLRPRRNSKPKRSVGRVPNRRRKAVVDKKRPHAERVARRNSTRKKADTRKRGNSSAASRHGKRPAARNPKPDARRKHRKP